MISIFQLMLEYAEKIREIEESHEKEKDQKLSALRKNLASERKRRKKELYEKQVQEAKQAGLDPTKVHLLSIFCIQLVHRTVFFCVRLSVIFG